MKQEVTMIAVLARCSHIVVIDFVVLTTYRTYHAESLLCPRVVQYSSMDMMVSFAASRHLKTARFSVLEEFRSLCDADPMAHRIRKGRYMTILRFLYRHLVMPKPSAYFEPSGGKTE